MHRRSDRCMAAAARRAPRQVARLPLMNAGTGYTWRYMGTINLTELKKLPHINAAGLGGRSMLLMPLWDGAAWNQWFDGPNGELIKIQIVDAIHSNYLAKAPAGEHDIWIAFVDFMWQRASWPEAVRLISGICDDFHLMATSTAKLEHFHQARESIDETLIGSFVKTEIEYLIVVARSVFDLLQEVIAHFWNERVRLLDPAMEAIRRRHKLPPEFAKIVLHNEILRTAAEISERYALPTVTAEMYAKHAQFFASLRTSRDGIIHGGSSVDEIFATEKGFCIDPKSRHYGSYPWKEQHYYNPNIVSLRPWIARTLFQTIEACSEIVFSLASALRFPDEIAPGYRVFIRDPSNKAFLRLLDVATGKLIWWDEDAHTNIPPQAPSDSPPEPRGIVPAGEPKISESGTAKALS